MKERTAYFLREYADMNRRLRRIDAELAATTASGSFVQAATLILIADGHDQPHRIASAPEAPSQSVTGLSDRLEKAGFVTRVRDLSDRRAVRIVLSENGKFVMRGLPDVLECAVKQVAS